MSVPTVEDFKKQFRNSTLKFLYSKYMECWNRYKELKSSPERSERELNYYYNCAEACEELLKERTSERASVHVLVRKSTRARLENVRQKGETMDDVIVRLLNFYEQSSEESLLYD